MARYFTRRQFLATTAAAGWWRPGRPLAAAETFPVRFRRQNPYEPLSRFIEPGRDEFAVEKQAAEIEAHLDRLLQTGTVPLAPDFQGVSPQPARHTTVAPGIARAEFDPADHRFDQGLRQWLASLGQVRTTRFYVLPGDRVRYEIASRSLEALTYRVGLWRQKWENGKLARFEPLEETVARAPMPFFEDVTSQMFGRAPSFQEQLARGVPYWRARLDAASGMDLYGNNGIAVGDIQGDGWDEVYVCQPGGLPNRLYKRRSDGAMEDTTERAGVGVLDNTACALFLDLRNIGRQDLIVATTSAPLLFLNQGDGTLRHRPDAFRFASAAQGTFTGMAAADYDRDGRLDLYLCTYVYFQSEDQYRYPVPYHDAENGPPNFLFRNRLTEDGGGSFEDVTAAVGLSENNNRFSFAPAWCDYDGDGWPDLYVANDFGRNNLYKNDRGHFRDVAAEAGVEDLGPGMSAAWLDYDGDGRLDLYVSNMWSAAGQRVISDAAFPLRSDPKLREGYRRHAKGNSLYRNRGDGKFDETGPAEGVEMGRWAWSSDGFDFDNDGAPELYVACGMLTNSSPKDMMSFFWRQVVARSPATKKASPDYEQGWNALNQWIREDYGWNGREPNVLYARRNGRFYDLSGVSGLDFVDDTRAFAATDFDGDGNLDLILKNRLGPQVRALRNRWGVSRRSIAIRLQGTRSNRDAIGAVVEVERPGGRSTQALRAGSGFLSQHTKCLYFGLGDAAAAQRIRIRWPSGLVQEFSDWPAGFRYEITEGSGEVKRSPFRARAPFSAAPPIVADNQPGLAAAWLLEPVHLPETRRGPGFLYLAGAEKPSVPAGVPIQTIDLTKASPDVAAQYAVLQRYLFDYRAGLKLPLLLLIDEQGRAHKLYSSIPSAELLRTDLGRLNQQDRVKLALPFAGQYYSARHRNHFQMGSAFYWAGYPEQALIYFHAALERDPDNALAHLAVGQIHLEAGRHDDAREHLDRSVALNPSSGAAWNALGSLQMAREDYRAALRSFEKSLAVLPNSSFALVGAGRAHVKLGDIPLAESFFRRALDLDANDAEAANQLGLLRAGQNRNDEARRLFQQAIAARRDHAGAINNLGVLYMQMGQTENAIAAFRYGMEAAPGDDTIALNLARVYVRLGDRAKAREILQQHLEQKPESSIARNALRELDSR